MGKVQLVNYIGLQYLYLIHHLSCNVFQPPYQRGVFSNVKGKYPDFNSSVMDLHTQYCRRACQERFIKLIKVAANTNCAPCYCDEQCYQYDDCCPDKILWAPTSRTNLSMVKSGCILTKHSHDWARYSKLVEACAPTYRERNTISDCLNNSYFHWTTNNPVTDPSTNITYRNKYCAICNYVNVTENWKTRTRCRSQYDFGNYSNPQEIYSSVLRNPNCSVSFEPPTIHIKDRSCIPEKKMFYTTCNETGKWPRELYDPNVVKACHLYTSVVRRQYKNIFCQICNAEYIAWSTLIDDSSDLEFAQFGLSLLFDLRDEGARGVIPRHQPNDKISNSECERNEFSSPITCKCVKKTCTADETLIDGHCQPLVSKSNFYGYNICVYMDGTVNKSNYFEHGPWVFPEWDTLTDVITEKYFTPIDIQLCHDELIHLKMEVVLKIFFTYDVDIDEKQRELLKKVYEAGEEIETFGYNVTTRVGRTCKPVNTPMDLQFIPFCSPIWTEPYRERTAPRPDVASLIPNIKFIKLNKLLTCTKVTMDADEFKLDNKTLRLLHNDIILVDGEFEEMDERVNVCIEDYIRGTSNDSCLQMSDQIIHNINTDMSTALGLTSVVCTCISMLSLLVTFVCYCTLKDIRDEIGVSVMGLIVNLFFAQALYEFGLELPPSFDYTMLCKIIGILIHYFWLSALFWMNGCTLILFLKLSYPLQCRRFNKMFIFKRCLLYSMLSPFLIVGITSVTNVARGAGLGYGSKYYYGYVCYISTLGARMIAFALPLGILVLANILLFIFTFVKIHRNQMKSTVNNKHKIRILACLKLSVITGATWAFAYMYEATGYSVFEYIFTVLVGTQGVVIFVTFILNKRVWAIISLKLKRPH
ncbi:hypothetical protein SNE40_006493 [Patella caerulea]|uniref:G-protein coupled receptors family 2 profile 2 domain-containing protein n=1 Tax=Patella caerulea TaxID=87958 RepID=A0AAN8Q148_PATCE